MSDAIIVAVCDDGRMTSVRRYRKSESDLAERDIVNLVRAGRQLRVSFIDALNGDGCTFEQRARLTLIADPEGNEVR